MLLKKLSTSVLLSGSRSTRKGSAVRLSKPPNQLNPLTREIKESDGTPASPRMVRRGGDAARVQALLAADATDCWHLHRWWHPCLLGARPPALRSKNNGPKEPQVGVMRSNLNELNISPARAALQPGVRTAEYSSLWQAGTQGWIAWIQATSLFSISIRLCGLLIQPRTCFSVLLLPCAFAMQKLPSPAWLNL